MNKKILILAWFLFLFPGLIAYAGGLAPTGSGASSSNVSGSVSITGTPSVNINNSSINTNSTISTVSVSLPMQYWELGKPSYATETNIGSNTITTIQNIASAAIVAHSLLTIQGNSKFHFDLPSVSSATMQYSDFCNNGDRIVWRIGTSTFDMGLIGDTVGGPASLSMKIYPLY